jgi:hypothetical protein
VHLPQFIECGRVGDLASDYDVVVAVNSVHWLSLSLYVYTYSIDARCLNGLLAQRDW